MIKIQSGIPPQSYGLLVHNYTIASIDHQSRQSNLLVYTTSQWHYVFSYTSPFVHYKLAKVKAIASHAVPDKTLHNSYPPSQDSLHYPSR